MNIDRLRKQLEIDEGCKYVIYLDHLNLPTHGIGHLILQSDPEHGQPVGTPVSEDRVIECFEKDLKRKSFIAYLKSIKLPRKFGDSI